MTKSRATSILKHIVAMAIFLVIIVGSMLIIDVFFPGEFEVLGFEINNTMLGFCFGMFFSIFVIGPYFFPRDKNK